MGGLAPAPKKELGRLREILIDMGVFDYGLYVVVGPYDDLLNYVNFRRPDGRYYLNWPAPRGRVIEGTRDYCPILWIPRKPRTPHEYGTLAHEAGHVARELVEFFHIKIDGAGTDEPLCHTIGYIVRTVLKELRA